MAIDIPVTFGDIESAIRGMERLSGSLSAGAKSGEDFAKAQERTAREMSELSGRVAAAAGQITSFGRIIGSDVITKIGDLTARTAASAQQFSQLGLALGPQGALVGGIVGALLPAIGDLIAAENDQEAASEMVREAAERERQAQLDLTDALREQASARRDLLDRFQGAYGSAGAAETALAEIRAEIEARQTQQRILREELRVAERIATPERIQAMRERLSEITGELSSLGIQADIAEERMQGFTQEAIRGAEDLGDQQRRRAEFQDLALQQELEFYDRIAAAERHLQEVQQERLRKEIESLQAVTAAREAATRRELAEKAAFEAVEAESARRVEDQRQAEARELEQVFALREQMESERSEKLNDELNMAFEVGTRVTETLGAAIGDVISGAKTSEEAFNGLLKSFLEMISEYTALMAAKEYAEAAASAARNDWPGFGLHVAAGAAFTAVAVATGIGAAAVNTKPSAAPEEPQRSSLGSGSGGDVIIQWNSPVVTTGTRAQLGREMRGMIREAEVRGI